MQISRQTGPRRKTQANSGRDSFALSREHHFGEGWGGSNDISLRRHQIRLSSWANTDTHIYAARKSDTHRDNREWQISLCGSRARQPNSLGNKEKNCPKERQKPKNRGKKLEKRKILILFKPIQTILIYWVSQSPKGSVV